MKKNKGNKYGMPLTNKTKIVNSRFDIVRYDKGVFGGECWSKIRELNKAHVYFVYPKGETDLLLFQTESMSSSGALKELNYFLKSVGSNLSIAA